jgi:hypothetical protein
MNTKIQIIRTDEKNHDAIIIALSNNEVIINNITLGKTQIWDLEDLKQCIIFK